MIIDDIFENWDKGCYIASLLKTETDEMENEINYYSKPKYYEFNIQSASGSMDIQLYGERIKKIKKALISMSNYKNVFKEGDKAYLEGIKPVNESEKTFGIGANYKIIDARKQNTAIILYFERI